MRLAGSAVLIAVGLVAAACGEHRPVLDEGVCVGEFCKEPRRVTEPEALDAGRRTLSAWKNELRRGARENPDLKFDNLAPAELRRRLDEAAEKNGFEVVSLKLHRPRQLAPEVVIRTSRYVDVAKSARVWLRAVDPQQRTIDDRSGWKFEGFYLRAEDEDGVPFFIVDNSWRVSDGGGGQWARSDSLFPFDHG